MVDQDETRTYLGRMLRIPPAVVTLPFLMILAGCQGPAPFSVKLPPPEVFTWTGEQPISFSPPPEDWRRSRYQNGGAEGVDFVKAGSKGEMIFIAERFFLGRNDRCDRLQQLLRDLEEGDLTTFDRDARKARHYANEPFNARWKPTVGNINGALDRAREACDTGAMNIAQVELNRALELAETIRFTVGETVDRVIFKAEENSVYPALRVDDPVEGEVGGEPAVIVNFTFEGHGTPMVGRRVYVVRNNRMFEAGFQGLAANLPMFEAVLESVTFPPGGCEH
jgi:hypothetical protein